MNARSRLDRRAGWASAFGVAAYCLASVNFVLAGLALLVVLVRFLLRRAGRSVSAPRPVVNAVAILAALWTIGRAFGIGGTRLDVDGFSVLLSLLILGKLFDWTRLRDSAQLLMLSAFLGLGAVLTSNELPVFAALLALCVTLAGGALWFQMAVVEARAEAARGERSAAQGAQRAARAVGDADPAARGVLAVTLPMVLSVSVVVFVLTPRGLGDGLFGDLRSAAAGGRVTGFSERVQLGAGGVISDSPTVVLDLALRTPDGRTLGGIMERYYLRGAVLDRYDPETGVWEASPGGAAPYPLRAGQGFMMGSMADATIVQEVTVRSAPDGESHIFCIWSPVRVEFARRETLIEGTSRTHALRRQGRGGKLTYTVWSTQEPTTRSGGQLSDDRWPQLDIPPVRAVADEILRQADIDPEEVVRVVEAQRERGFAEAIPFEANGLRLRAVRALEQHLRRNYAYTLDLTATPPGRDPIEWFLTEERTGHCEYFASALAAMCRTLGIGARVVTGYLAMEFNETTNHYVVRESNAHAWVEAEVAPGVWRRFDATPDDDLRRLHEPSQSFWAQIGRIFDAVEYGWINSVVGFDEGLRTELLGLPSFEDGPLAAFAQRLGRRLDRGGAGLVAQAAFNAAAAFAVTMALGWGAALGVRWLRGRAWDRPGSIGDAMDQIHASLLSAMRAAGHAKPAHTPVLRFAESLRSASPGLADPAVRAARIIYEVRFAGRAPDADTLEEARGLVRQVREVATRDASAR